MRLNYSSLCYKEVNVFELAWKFRISKNLLACTLNKELTVSEDIDNFSNWTLFMYISSTFSNDKMTEFWIIV